MAEQAETKTVEHLKMERTIAKRAFSRLANSIMRTYEDMSEDDLRESFNRLMKAAERLLEINDDFEAKLIADQEATLGAGEAATLIEQQKVDLTRTAKDCELRLKEIKDVIQETLWSNFGNVELSTALRAAERESQRVTDVQLSGSLAAYDFMLTHLQQLVKTAKEAYNRWKRWIPSDEQKDIQGRIKELELTLPSLVSRKADFIQVKLREEAERPALTTAPDCSSPAIRLKPITLPKFAGVKRDFHRWKKDWEAVQRQGEPTGSKEVKKFQLLDSLDERITRDLRLTAYNSAEDIFRVLENRFGNKVSIAIEIVEELQEMPAVKGHQPRRIVELIQAVEKALQDLIDLGDTGAIKNPLVTKSIESKLPETLKKDWLVYAADERNAVVSSNRFDSLLKFLKEQEHIYEQLEQLRDDEPSRSFPPRTELRHARTRATELGDNHEGCVVCGDVRHRKKLFFCKQFKSLRLMDKKTAVRKLGACEKCLEIHDTKTFCKPTFLCRNQDCRDECVAEHHYFLCPNAEIRKNGTVQRATRHGLQQREGKEYTSEQEEFLSTLPPDVAKQCRDVFSNTASKTLSTVRGQPSLLMENGLQELPVIMMLLEVTANAGQRIGTLIDLASDTNYITHSAASRLNLKSEDITLIVHGVGGMNVQVETKRYLLKIRVKTPKGTLCSHQLVCYGLDSIANVHRGVSAKELQKFFPDVLAEELVRPKEISLLISHREGKLAPQRIQVVGDLVLWDGPLGKTVGGTHPDLFEESDMSAHMSKTHFARSMRTAAVRYEERMAMVPGSPSPYIQDLKESRTLISNQDFLKWWKWDSIGAACEPRCGGCRCGNCQPGGKEMTLAEERELEVVREGLTYVTEDHHSKGSHWHAKYPWLEDPASLPNNRKAVEATFLRTEKQLSKEPEWKIAYAAQVHDMVARGAAVKLSEDVITSWDGPVWYVSHLIAPNPHSVTTPVRLVWNSSQRFRGVSLNDLLMKGPDVLNQIRAVLLRFRGGVFAALGDIRKMYNSVWLEDREMHLHRFLWRDSNAEELGEYAITRVNIGDKPAGCIAQLAMRETSNLPPFAHFEEERRVLQQDSYVDDLLTSHNDLEHLKTITVNVESILKAGGFELKPWVFSGQSGRKKSDGEERAKTGIMVLPNQMGDDDNKALGLGYVVEEDKLYVMTTINFSKRKKKMRLGQDLSQGQVRAQTPNPLTRRELLSQVAGLYDPGGLVTPAKQKGAILVRKAFQEAKGGARPVRDTWDTALSDGLREDAIELFEEYVQLGKVKFIRALTPPVHTGEPCAVTFSDGSEHAYGAVMYLRWDTDQGPVIRLVESKAKLTPLDHKGDAVKAEMCGAVFASRLKKYFETHSKIHVKRWYHFVDSQTVLGAIQRESYGYQTFFANRIGEIQGNTQIQDWWWVPGQLNIADIITRGASPQDLDEDSEWQGGPKFLSLPVQEWPIKSAKDIVSTARENVNKLQKKAFVAVLTRSKVGEREPSEGQNRAQEEQRRPPAGMAIRTLVDVKRFSDLAGLVKAVAWTWRAAKRFLGRSRAGGKAKWEAVPLGGIISVREREDALRDIFLAAQEGVAFPSTTTDRLVVYKDQDSGLLVCGGRLQSFEEDHTAAPVLPYEAWVSMLVAREAHVEGHDGVAGTLLKMRRKAWVIRGRRLCQKVVDGCVICKKAKARRCQQVMGDLPPERTEPAAPFEFTAVDLFGPFQVKDDIKKRVALKVWGAVFCCMASRAIHVELVNSVSTEGFLMAYQRFTAIRGHPRKIWSDPGTNFVGARPVLEELYRFLDGQNRIALEETAARNGTEWTWKIHPADSPHRNGAAEAAVRVVKRALQSLGKEFALSYSEFQTALCMAANLANERPIDARVQSREDCINYVTPNSLLLGRASQSGDVKAFDFASYPYKRLRAMQAEVIKFWRCWSQLAGPNLFVRSKWHTVNRNVAVGDVVWLCDQNALRGQFKLGVVVGTNPDCKGIVRDADVRVFPSYCVPLTRTPKVKARHPNTRLEQKIQSTVLHRDVRRLVVLLPVEEQST